MRRRCFCRLAVAVCTSLVFLVSCNKQNSESQTDAISSGQSGNHKRDTPGPFEVTTASGVEMISLPGGEFLMGSDKGNPDEAPVHKVKLSPFLIDEFEVTHEMFGRVQLPNPSHWQDSPRKPVERVRWRDAKVYCNERSLLEKLKPCYNEKTADFDCDFSADGYRLPTEAEWEYA